MYKGKDIERGRSVIGSNDLLTLTSQVVAAYVSSNQVPVSEVSTILRSVHDTLSEAAGIPSEGTHSPAVPIKRSVSEDFIVCLEDGKKLRTLRRYLRTHYDMSPEEYRTKWNLPRDYPMVAPSYAKLRSAFAKKIGLGRAPSGRRKRAK